MKEHSGRRSRRVAAGGSEVTLRQLHLEISHKREPRESARLLETRQMSRKRLSVGSECVRETLLAWVRSMRSMRRD